MTRAQRRSAKADKIKKELQINNTMQIAEELRCKYQMRLVYHSSKTKLQTSRGRSGKVRIYTTEEIRRYESR